MAAQRRGGVHEAVRRFTALLEFAEGQSPAVAQRKARSGFPGRVSKSRLKLRRRSAPLAGGGKQFLIGVATWSAEDLQLLDELDEALDQVAGKRPDVQVFDVVDCERMSDFVEFIPGIGEVYGTPVVGVFRDGELIDRATGLDEVNATLRRFNVLGPSSH